MEYFVTPRRTLSYRQALEALTEAFGPEGVYEDNEGERHEIEETLRNHDPATYNPTVAIQWLGDFRAQIWELGHDENTNALVAETYYREEN